MGKKKKEIVAGDQVTRDVYMEKFEKAKKTPSVKRSPKTLTPTPATVRSSIVENPKAISEEPVPGTPDGTFADYLKDVKDLISGNDILFKVICQDFTGPAAKYKGTAFGNLERDLISQCWRMKLPAQTCAGHLWLMMKNSI